MRLQNASLHGKHAVSHVLSGSSWDVWDDIESKAKSLSKPLKVELFEIKGIEVTPGAIIGFVLTVIVAMILGRMVRRGLLKIAARRSRGDSEGSAYAVARIAQYVVTVAGILMGLENVGVSLGTLAALGAVFAVGLGFGLQNIAQNFISGLILLFERPVAKGDVVIVSGSYGIVDEISIRATRIMTFDNIAMIVPNSKLISEVVENRSEPTNTYRSRIDVGVSYGSDTRSVERVLLEVARSHEKVLGDPEPVVFFVNYGSSALEFQLCVWLDDPMVGLGVASDLRHKITDAFRKHGIEIPFPQRDLHLKTTPEGFQAG